MGNIMHILKICIILSHHANDAFLNVQPTRSINNKDKFPFIKHHEYSLDVSSMRKRNLHGCPLEISLLVKIHSL